MEIFECKYCKSKNLVLESRVSGENVLTANMVALKCADCGKWIKWCPKEERHFYIKEKESTFTFTQQELDQHDAEVRKQYDIENKEQIEKYISMKLDCYKERIQYLETINNALSKALTDNELSKSNSILIENCIHPQLENKIRKREKEKVIDDLEEWLDNAGYDVYVGDNHIKDKKLKEKLNEMKGE